jgi:hypothetical protein
MSVELSASGTIELTGECESDDAEVLLQHLLATPAATVDWRGCESAHSAVIQVLLAARPPFLGPPAGESLKRWIAPLLPNVSP